MKGIIAAVNHNGDSDSTGSITGNILGAYIGFEAIDNKWKEDLQLKDVIIEIADDLCHGCQMYAYSSYKDEEYRASIKFGGGQVSDIPFAKGIM